MVTSSKSRRAGRPTARPRGSSARTRPARELVGAAREGNAEALEAIVEIGRRLGAAIGSLVNIFEPEVVVIGGGFSQARDLFLEPALETMREEALQPGRDLVRVLPALLGPDAGLVGAGFVGFEAVQ